MFDGSFKPNVSPYANVLTGPKPFPGADWAERLWRMEPLVDEFVFPGDLVFARIGVENIHPEIPNHSFEEFNLLLPFLECRIVVLVLDVGLSLPLLHAVPQPGLIDSVALGVDAVRHREEPGGIVPLEHPTLHQVVDCVIEL